VLARPTDDAPRLVLADALTESGDARGELIVVECLLADRGLNPGRRAHLRRRAQALRTQLEPTWAPLVRGLRQWQMRRGFVDEVTASAREILARANDLFAAEPVTRLTVTEASGADIAALAETDVLSRLARLTVRGRIGDEGARALAAVLVRRKSPLHALNVGRAGIGSAGAAALADALEGCCSLVLTGNAIGDEGLSAIASSKRLGSLEALFVAENEITDEGLFALAKAATLGALARLGVARNDEVTQDGLRAIARSKKLRNLRWLEFTDEDEGMQRVVVRKRR
jgi:uncharacterized protein (TIGR02996 family)